jgi:hypothetical protein
MTFKERWQELKRIYGGRRREIRWTAVGWQPPGEGWTQDPGPTPSRNKEYYTVVRPGARPDAEQPARLTAAERKQIELDLQREG